MEGMGIYFWQDGRKYQGQYKDDKKHGFGQYIWADGRTYEGYWFRGKQHGLGKYIVPKDEKVKFGLWEDGKRIEWFSEEQTQEINQGSKSYLNIFHVEESANMVDEHALLMMPSNFNESLEQVK